jgi:hypothetical protein
VRFGFVNSGVPQALGVAGRRFRSAPETAMARIHWNAVYDDDGWAVAFRAYRPGGGDPMPFWMRDVRFDPR